MQASYLDEDIATSGRVTLDNLNYLHQEARDKDSLIKSLNAQIEQAMDEQRQLEDALHGVP
jgi:hypothetical protein